MNKLIIKGNAHLDGEICISGAKNAALPILISTLLTDKKTVIRNIPHLKDITTVMELLGTLGARLAVGDNFSIEIDSSDVHNFSAPYDLVKTMRASILVLGPLLSRYGRANVSFPGGCAIGARPIDIHLKGMKAMGASIEIEKGYIKASVNGKLKGSELLLDTVTVTGTENLMMAATLADGVTVIKNAAQEPEVVDLANFLNTLGAKISGHGSDTIVIEGVNELSGGNYSILPDRIEAGTYLIATALTRGKIKIKHVRPDTLDAVIMKLRETGADIVCNSDWIKLDMHGNRPCAVSLKKDTLIEIAEYLDLEAQMFIFGKCCAEGTGSITENYLRK